MGTAQRDANRKKGRGGWKRLGWLAVLAQYNTPEDGDPMLPEQSCSLFS